MTSFTRRHLLGSVATAALLPIIACAHNGHDHGIATPAASPMPGMDHLATNSGTGAVYMTITNNGDQDDVLRSAVSKAARLVQIHTMKVSDGVMQMQELTDGLEIPAGSSVVLDPDDLHFMLVDLQHDLTPGSTLEITLTLEHAGEITLPVPVQWEAPTDDVPVVAGDFIIEHAWARPAPMITAGSATPAATPEHHHH